MPEPWRSALPQVIHNPPPEPEDRAELAGSGIRAEPVADPEIELVRVEEDQPDIRPPQ